MAIKKAQANFDIDGDGSYDIIHYETQIKQVKVIDANGTVTGDLDTELTGIKNDISTVDSKADSNASDISDVSANVGNVSTLETTAKKVVPAINEVKTKTDSNASSITSLDQRVSTNESDIANHNHDSVYLKITGGDLSGTATMTNTKSFAGKTTGGTVLNIGKVDNSNQVVLGDRGAKAIIESSSTDLKITDGTNTYTVFHAGNMGIGSNLDADKLDGVEGSSYARKDLKPVFTAGVELGSGTDIILKASNGSSDAGDLIWQKGDGTQLGRITTDVNGSIAFYSGGQSNYHSMKSTGEFVSSHQHILDATDREVSVRFRKDASDAGMGLYLNNNTNRLGIYDWQSSKFLMTTDRITGAIDIFNLNVQGHKLSIQSTAPASPSVGDIWFAI